MPKSIKLQIPEPCHEDWNKMTEVEKGRHCESCNKTVVDFTSMSDAHLLAFFHKRTSNVCGRFSNEQIGREIVVPQKRLPWLKYLFQFLIPLFLATIKSNGQGELKLKTRSVETDLNQVDKALSGALGGVVVTSKRIIASEMLITGYVKDEKGNPIAYASVMIKDSNRGTTTNPEGEFRLKVPSGRLTTVIISTVGYYSCEQIVQGLKKEHLEVQLDKMEDMGHFVGLISIEKPIRLGKRRVVDPLPDHPLPLISSFKIYPNPSRSNSTIYLNFKESIPEKFSICLSGLSGQKIAQYEIVSPAKNAKIPLRLPILIEGFYFIRITDPRTQKTFIEKLKIVN